MTERSPGVWRLQTTSDPDAVTGATRRLSRTFRGSKGGGTVTVAVLLASLMNTATLSPTTRQDWTSVINRYLIPELGDVAL